MQYCEFGGGRDFGLYLVCLVVFVGVYDVLWLWCEDFGWGDGD